MRRWHRFWWRFWLVVAGIAKRIGNAFLDFGWEWASRRATNAYRRGEHS